MSWIARLIALALVAVLADATVASLHGTTLALEAAGGGTAVALATLALFWRRPWIAVAFGLLALAGAFAAGTLAGIGGGPAFTGVLPSDAAAIVFAAGILAAAIAACVAARNGLVRALVLVLAAYALAATVASIQHGGLTTAFLAGPLAWTRGPYVAAEVLCPLAAVVAAIYGLVQLFRKRGAAGVTALVLALMLVAEAHLGALAAGASGLPTIVSFERSPLAVVGHSTIGADAAQPANAIPGAGAVTAGASSADTGPLFVPAGTSVPAEVGDAATHTATDPQHALAAVAALADEIYPGALAGSVGALRSGSANSVDKALLLHELLRAGMRGTETAFARCTLPPADANALIAQVRAARAPAAKVLAQAASSALSGTTDPSVRAALQPWAQTWKTLVSQTQGEGKKLTAALHSAGLTLPSGPPANLRAMAAQHVWVRVRVNGTWTDLDPTIQPAAPGKTRCAAQTQTTTLPDDLYDVLGVRVAIEQLGIGGAQRTIVFDRTVRTADVGDLAVSFMFAEPVGMDSVLTPAPASPPPGALSYTPLLRVGDENVTGTPILLPVPQGGDAGTATAKGAAGAAGAFDLGASPTPLATTAPTLPAVSGVWLELSVTAPGSQPTAVQSPIFDRLGFAARAAHAPAPALRAQPENANYQAMQTVWNVVVAGGHTASAGGPAELSEATDIPALSDTLARLNSDYYAVRRALADDARGTGAEVPVAAVQPGISLVGLTDGGVAMDVASDATVPLAADEERPLWAAASVLAERALIAGGLLPVDALAAFDRATANGARALALRPADAAPPQSVAVSNDARARMSARLAQGDSLLALTTTAASAGPAPYAYWIVDPAAGTLRDENAFGRHPEMPEDAPIEKEVPVKNASTFRKLACKILPAVRMTALAFGLLTLGGQGGSSAAQMAKLAAKIAEQQQKNEGIGKKAADIAGGTCSGGPPKP